MKFFLPMIVAGIIVGVGTYFEGNWTERWSAHRDEKLKRFTHAVEVVREQLAEFDDDAGEHWTSVDKAIDPEVFKKSGCTASISRTYANSDGETIEVYVAAGHSRHITIHTPKWCYPGAGFKGDGDPDDYSIEVDGMKANPQFLSQIFRKKDEELGTVLSLRILWTYTEDGAWRGPRMPKPAYGNRPALFKVYLITPLTQTSAEDEERLRSFARSFMPRATTLLFDEATTEASPDSAPSDDDIAAEDIVDESDDKSST